MSALYVSSLGGGSRLTGRRVGLVQVARRIQVVRFPDSEEFPDLIRGKEVGISYKPLEPRAHLGETEPSLLVKTIHGDLVLKGKAREYAMVELPPFVKKGWNRFL